MRQNTVLSETYSTVQTRKSEGMLESFTFEDIYFRRVPGATSLEELSNDNLITIRRCRGYLMTLAYS